MRHRLVLLTVLFLCAVAASVFVGANTAAQAQEPGSCETHCECPQGEFCFYNKCVSDPSMPVYCCENEGCPPGTLCLKGDGSRSRCAEDPDYSCDTACDCGPAHCCKNGICVKDINDPWIPDGVEVGPPCIRGVDGTYCHSEPDCYAGMAAYADAGYLSDFRCQRTDGAVETTCAGSICFFSGDCNSGQSCVDTDAYPATHPGSIDTVDGGSCLSNAAAEAIYGYAASDLMPPCSPGFPAGTSCEAGWRPGETFAIERVVGVSGSCGNTDNKCDFNLLETTANCPTDCSCGDGYCDTSEVGVCTADCGLCTADGCGQPIMPLEWTTISTCGDGVCQKDGTIPENCINCQLDCDAATDSDGDGIPNGCDGCPTDSDKAGPGSCGCGVPDDDGDGDGYITCEDNCPLAANPDQADHDGDAVGDACDPDDDNDGVVDTLDAFPLDATESVDTDGDGVGDNADIDDDNDGQTDADEVACGSDPLDATSLAVDVDQDSIPDCVDPNLPPTIEEINVAPTLEGSFGGLSVSAVDVEGDTLTYEWSVINIIGDVGMTCVFGDPLDPSTTIGCTDDGLVTVEVAVSDGTDTTRSEATVEILNAPPIIVDAIATNPTPIGSQVRMDTWADDPGENDDLVCTVDWGTASATTAASDGHCTVTTSELPLGVHVATVVVSDDNAGTSPETELVIVVYDTSGRKVIGAGEVDDSLRIGFNIETKKDGSTEGILTIRMTDDNVPDFHATSVDSLLILSEWAVARGHGVLDTGEPVEFLLTLADTKVGAPDDAVRIKLWRSVDPGQQLVVFDTQSGDPDHAMPTTVIQNGNINIKKG